MNIFHMFYVPIIKILHQHIPLNALAYPLSVH